MRGEAYQSFGLHPLKTTFVKTWFGPGVGMGESIIWTLGPLLTMASFIAPAWVLAARTWPERKEKRLKIEVRTGESIGTILQEL